MKKWLLPRLALSHYAVFRAAKAFFAPSKSFRDRQAATLAAIKAARVLLAFLPFLRRVLVILVENATG